MSIQQISSFTVTVIENSEELEKLQKWASDCSNQAEQLHKTYKTTDEKISQIFKDNWNMMSTISSVIENKLDPIYAVPWKDYKVAVSSDSADITQAIAVIRRKYKFEQFYYTKLCLLASAYWNLHPEKQEQKVKGAGTSIIQFCCSLDKGLTKGEVYLEALESSIPFYKKLSFEILPEKIEYGKTTMILSADNVKKLLNK